MFTYKAACSSITKERSILNQMFQIQISNTAINKKLSLSVKKGHDKLILGGYNICCIF